VNEMTIVYRKDIPEASREGSIRPRKIAELHVEWDAEFTGKGEPWVRESFESGVFAAHTKNTYAKNWLARREREQTAESEAHAREIGITSAKAARDSADEAAQSNILSAEANGIARSARTVSVISLGVAIIALLLSFYSLCNQMKGIAFR
jgi:hypothetical protein